MKLLTKLFTGYESDIYDSPREQLQAMRRWDVEWQKYRSSERFHIIKRFGKFDSDYFFKIVRDVKHLIGADIGYEGIELYPIVGACTTWACKAHSANAKTERSIMAQDVNNIFSCEVRLDMKEKTPDKAYVEKTWNVGCLQKKSKPTMWSNYIWLCSENYGKRIKFQWSLDRDVADRIIDRYFSTGNGYGLGDGFI